jgi:hypothetical protein
MPAGSVIQGMFPHGLPRVGVAQPMQAVRAVPDWVRQRIAFGHAPAPNAPAPNAASPVQRQVMQRMTPNGSAVAIAPPPAFGRAPGQPLPANVRQMMESAFRTSFADVRIHIDPHAPAIGALAFTTGTNIHFAPGQWNPQTPQGQRILAHELAHVVQQRSGRVRNPFGSGLAVVHDAVLEAEAERMSRGFVVQRADSGVVPIEIDEPPKPVQVWEGSEDQNPNKPAFKEVKAIVASAIAGGGAPTAKTLLMPLLTGILNSETVKKAMPASSDETYAIGTNGATVFLSGSGNFVKAAMKVVKDIGALAFEDIGGRGNFSHGESHIIQSAPSVTAIAATQDCCLFCYGFLRKSGKDHQGLRAHPFPKGWIHPVMGFKLTRVSSRMFVPKGLILLITLEGEDALYRLDV